MEFRINRVRFVSRDDTGFSELLSALPDGVDECFYCGRPAGRRSPDAVAMVLIADESDDNPLAVYSVVCSTCSAVHPKDQILAEWAEELGGPEIPDLHGSGRA